MKAGTHTDVCTPVIIAGLVTKAKTEEQVACFAVFVSVINWVLCVLHTHLTSFDPHNHPVNSPYSEMSPCRSNGTKVPTVTETKVARSVLRAGPSQQSQRLLPTHWKSTLGINHLSTQKTLRTKYVPSFPLCGLKFWGSSLPLAHADCSACPVGVW